MVQPPVKYLQLHFATAVELNKILSNLFDNDFYVVKIEPGILSGVLTISFGEEDVYASITANRALFLCSEKRMFISSEEKRLMSCFSCFDNHPEAPIGSVRNFSNDLSDIAPQILSGFSNKTRFRHLIMPAKSRLLAYGCPVESLESYMKLRGTNYAKIANEANNILPPIMALNEFRIVVKSMLRHIVCEDSNAPYSSEMVKESLSKCFDSSAKIEKIPLKVIQRHELCKDLVAFGYANVDKFISLELVIQQLHTTRASVSQGCKEALTIGPMEVLRFIRLDHVHQALSDPAIRQKLNLQSVEMIRKYYGFMSRGNFAGTYKTYFEESPKDTLMRSRIK